MEDKRSKASTWKATCQAGDLMPNEGWGRCMMPWLDGYLSRRPLAAWECPPDVLAYHYVNNRVNRRASIVFPSFHTSLDEWYWYGKSPHTTKSKQKKNEGQRERKKSLPGNKVIPRSTAANKSLWDKHGSGGDMDAMIYVFCVCKHMCWPCSKVQHQSTSLTSKCTMCPWCILLLMPYNKR